MNNIAYLGCIVGAPLLAAASNISDNIQGSGFLDVGAFGLLGVVLWWRRQDDKKKRDVDERTIRALTAVETVINRSIEVLESCEEHRDALAKKSGLKHKRKKGDRKCVNLTKL